ncbi:MAG: ABC transporter ATP-binding protein [Pseudomonadota bacterium]
MKPTDPTVEEPTERLDTDVRALSLVRRLWRDYLFEHWPWLLLATVLMGIEGSTLGVLSYALQPMFDRVLVGQEIDAVWLIGGGIMALFCIRAVAGVAQRIILTRVGFVSTTALQRDILGHMMTLDSLFFHDHGPGELMDRVLGDTSAVGMVWQSLIQGAARDTISLLALAIVAIAIDPVWTAVTLVGIPVLVLPAILLQRYLRRKATSIRETSSQRSVRLSEIFNGIELVKLNRLEEHQTLRFKDIVDSLIGMEVKSAGGRSMLPGLLDVMTGVGFFAVLLFGANEIISGEKTVGQFMSFFTAMALAFQPMRRLAGLAGILQTTAARLERIYRLLDRAPAVSSDTATLPVPETGDIVFDHVHFGYHKHPVLNGASFTAEAGKTTAFVGPSGAGKSTVFKLLTRLVEAESGAIRFGGAPISDMSVPELRDRFSFVTQEAPLFDESLRENIVLNRGDISDADLARVLEDAALTEAVASMPEGLDTRAGPRGSNLSGGQRQRIAIARAVIRNAPILLLDEATSALDAQTEAAIQDALVRLSAGRTTLVIAHRLATVRSADKIVVMDEGRVVEEGTHEALLAADGLYAGLYRLQFRER